MTYLPDLKYIPDALTSITPKTLVAKGVPLSLFLNGTTLSHIPSIEDRKQLVRNYMPQAHIFNLIKNNVSQFSNYRLVIEEGLYKYTDNQKVVEGSALWLQSKGRQVVYTLSLNGKQDTKTLVSVAEYLGWACKFYDEIAISADNINPNGKLHLEIIVTVPEIPNDYNVRFKNKIKSIYNGIEYPDDIIGFDDAPKAHFEPPIANNQSVAGVFTVGDQHSRLLAEYGGTGWQTYAADGRTSRSQVVIENIKKIREKSTCIISVGYNDVVTNLQDSVEDIISNIEKIVQASQDAKHNTVFLLLPVVLGINEKRTVDVRNGIRELLNTKFKRVEVQDLNSYDRVPSSPTLSQASYVEIARKYL